MQMKMDLHIHSIFSSDGREKPEDIVKHARKIGLDGIAVLDHNDVQGSLKAYEISKEMDNFLVVRGVEVSTDSGHIIGYGICEPITSRMSIEETIETIHSLGGIAVAPHPYRFWSGIGGRSAASCKFSAIETQNGRCTARNNRKSRSLARRLKLGQTGGTDSHTLDEIGKAFTQFEGSLETEEEVIEEIVKCRTKVNGESRHMLGTLEYVYSAVTKWIRRGMKKI